MLVVLTVTVPVPLIAGVLFKDEVAVSVVVLERLDVLEAAGVLPAAQVPVALDVAEIVPVLTLRLVTAGLGVVCAVGLRRTGVVIVLEGDTELELVRARVSRQFRSSARALCAVTKFWMASLSARDTWALLVLRNRPAKKRLSVPSGPAVSLCTAV